MGFDIRRSATVWGSPLVERVIAPGACRHLRLRQLRKDILPVMEASCLNCHGADVQLAKLDLRTREAAIRAATMARRSCPAMRTKADCSG